MRRREIPLTRGKVAIVSGADYKWLSQWKWYAHRQKARSNGSYMWYAWRKEGPRNASVLIQMHRMLAGEPAGMDVDHKDGDGLHNWRRNLRVSTRAQNMRNRINRKAGATSSYIGVSFQRGLKRPWRTDIRVDGVTHRLGTFATEEDAARAYDDAARRYSGKFATFNFPERSVA